MKKEVRILVITAHPDDETICAGTLIKARKKGARLFQVVLTDAGEGKDRSSDGKESYEQTVRKREKEMRKVADRLGMEKVYFMRQEDLGLSYSKKLMIKVMRIVRQVRPWVVILMNKTDEHPDHQVAYQIGLQAVKWAATGIKPELGKPVRVKMLLQMGGMWEVRPDLIVDVTDVAAEKLAALKLHGSQADEKMVRFETAYMTLYGYHLRMGENQLGEPFEFCPEFPSVELIDFW